VGVVKHWDLRALAPSSEKETARAPGADAPRVPRAERQMPRVLFSSPECRAIVLDLAEGAELAEHHVRERAVVEVVFGRVAIDCSGDVVECGAGTLVTFEPHELHAVRALAESRLLLLLAPWPAASDAPKPEAEAAEHLPANASSNVASDPPAAS
jgi:quercetin dioxygenase-like cupin family protein